MLALFASAALTSAFLLFWVEPLFARLVLPLLGGSPAVWNTCLMYFQAVLLFGYLYAHASSRWLSPRRQIILHLALLAVAFVQLPLGLPAGRTPPGSANVIPWLIGVLTVSIGAPFLVLSATAPLLQRWLASSERPVENPYVLYAASNAGSFLGLLAFPFVLEPALRLHEQSVLWSVVYVIAFALVGLSAAVIWRHLPHSVATVNREAIPALPPRWDDRAKWVAFAFVPSSLLLGVTTFLSTDVAATPLLWVIPLSLYLLTFVIVFSSVGEKAATGAAIVHAVLVTAFALVLFWQASIGFRWSYALHLGLFFFTTLVLHGRLAASRPKPVHLTEYYLWMAFGGALGGAFTALIVPLIFESTRDYTMMVVIACFLRPGIQVLRVTPATATKITLIVAVPALALFLIPKASLDTTAIPGISFLWFAAAIVTVSALLLMKSPIQFATAIAAVVIAGLMNQASRGTVYRDRSFFGIYRVANAVGPARVLYHGTTIHGAQFTDSTRRLLPITYYHPDGPVGDVFRSLDEKLEGRNIGIVGLGTGSILCYSKPGEHWTFFEIDPHVAAIARNPQFFTFLSSCAVKPEIVFGDARLTLAHEAERKFSVLVLDAFSSDAIPVHLLTREAMNLYLRVLTDDGVLMVHISNRRLDLEPVVGDLAEDAGLASLIKNHDVPNSKQNSDFDYGSDWVILARNRADFGVLASDTLWRPVTTSTRGKVWTDDYSNILSVIKW